ncbi:aspartate carbamoyltransferase [Angomonas deanei]|nr:aspartate carbamoyltransferase [Angomonas deanei]|eukprot:EPY38888.1 aspartate carbamoyltransferase [Angomonas deanei]
MRVTGPGEHPTQALLDALTIHAELGGIDGKTIALIGDLKMGRTVHSLLKLLVHNFSLRKVYLVAPGELHMPQEVLDYIAEDLKSKNTELVCVSALSAEIVSDSDVLYATRLQKERFTTTDGSDPIATFNKALKDIVINKERLKDAKEKMIVMHPLPRVDELSSDVDNDPRAAYFVQMSLRPSLVT